MALARWTCVGGSQRYDRARIPPSGRRRVALLRIQTYPARKGFLLIGIVLAVIGVVSIGIFGYHFVSGVPLFDTPHRAGQPHIAINADLDSEMLMLLVFPAIGAGFIWFQRTASVTLEPDAVVLRGAFGKLEFRERFDEIQRIGMIMHGNLIRHFHVETAEKLHTISDVYTDFEDMRVELVQRCPYAQVD